MNAGIAAYHAGLADSDRAICELLHGEIEGGLVGAEGRVWHAHPVWFIRGNPIVGYHKLKSCVRLLFWSGQSFEEPGLAAEGSFKAAEARYTAADQVDRVALARWLEKARTIQWDYQNLRKTRGVLARLPPG